jgi:hypothetical protein
MVPFQPYTPPTGPRALPGIARAVFAALDAVLEEGVPRTALADAGLDTRHVEQWIRGFVHADPALEGMRAQLHGSDAPAGLAPDDPALVRMLVAAAALAALARAAARDAVTYPAFGARGRPVDEAFAYALRTRDRTIWHALSTAAA